MKGTVEGRRMNHTIKGSFTIRGTIEGSFTIRGRRMKRTIKRSFRYHHLSQDIITNILSRLSVKVLMRFKGVCKRWRDLIESSGFVTLHHDKMSTKRKSLILSSLYKSDVSTFSSDNLEVSRYVDFPFLEDKTSPCAFISIYGPCNGVCCLYDSDSRDKISKHNEYIAFDYIGYTVALWNLATREFKALPKCCTRRSYLSDGSIRVWWNVNLGFGYDRNNNDYKVVEISECGFGQISGERHTRVEVYSLNNDRWREIETTVPIGMVDALDSCSASLKGIHYWLSDKVILSFNLSDEVFETIELPIPHENRETMRASNLLVLHDSLALVRPYSYYNERRFEVWKLKENNGGVKSWTKISTIRPPSEFMPSQFLGFFEDGNAVIKDFHGRLMLYDLETHGNKLIRNNDDDADLMMHFYVESLGSVRGGGRLTTPSSFRKLACYDEIFSFGYDDIFSPL